MSKKPKYTIIEKAYELDLSKLDDGYSSADIYCHAESRNKARAKLLHTVRYDDWKLKHSNEPLNYWNIPIFRSKKNDLVLFQNVPTVKWKVEEIKQEKHRIDQLEKLAANDKISKCYIMKRGEYYRPNKRGYTSIKSEAGIYEKEDAISEARHCSDIRLEPW